MSALPDALIKARVARARHSLRQQGQEQSLQEGGRVKALEEEKEMERDRAQGLEEQWTAELARAKGPEEKLRVPEHQLMERSDSECMQRRTSLQVASDCWAAVIEARPVVAEAREMEMTSMAAQARSVVEEEVTRLQEEVGVSAEEKASVERKVEELSTRCDASEREVTRLRRQLARFKEAKGETEATEGGFMFAKQMQKYLLGEAEEQAERKMQTVLQTMAADWQLMEEARLASPCPAPVMS